MNTIETMTIGRPDDWHVHLRVDALLAGVVGDTAEVFGRALVMPNLRPPILNTVDARVYMDRIRIVLDDIGILPEQFTPLMTIYLTDKTTPEDIIQAKQSGIVLAAKLYPADATTNSDSGVRDIGALAPVFKAMAEVGLVLSIHGETLVSTLYGDATRSWRVGQLRREPVFISETLTWMVREFPDLKIVFEHISTEEAVSFVLEHAIGRGANLAATITAHHLLATLDDALHSHHNKCMPVLKQEADRQALLWAARSETGCFFAGTDSAPHPKSAKETACGCAGAYTAVAALPLYATALEEVGKLSALEGFISHYGADFYGLPRNSGTITLVRKPWVIPSEIWYKGGEIVPFWAGKEIAWQVQV